MEPAVAAQPQALAGTATRQITRIDSQSNQTIHYSDHAPTDNQITKEIYPQIPEHELRNFLIYVHGDTKKARERLAACVAWRNRHLPIRKEEIQQPLKQGIFFFHGQDVAGRPVGYFRLLKHDRKKRSIEEHVKVS